ncbi:hypothetical protein V8G54_008900 [Vigna mungo]|uniref:Uncharacterized protein n=1 Tax=Vigna mungo TaxID=3915 RepID=A0AAQ3P815_VIGMU
MPVPVVHRRMDAETRFTTENMKKEIGKALRNLKAIQNKLTVSSSIKDKETSSIFSFLKEAEVVTVNCVEASHLFKAKPSVTDDFHSHAKNLELCIEDIEVGIERLSGN